MIDLYTESELSTIDEVALAEIGGGIDGNGY